MGQIWRYQLNLMEIIQKREAKLQENDGKTLGDNFSRKQDAVRSSKRIDFSDSLWPR